MVDEECEQHASQEEDEQGKANGQDVAQHRRLRHRRPRHQELVQEEAPGKHAAQEWEGEGKNGHWDDGEPPGGVDGDTEREHADEETHERDDAHPGL